MLKRSIFNLIDRFTFREGRFDKFFAETAKWTIQQLKDYQLKKLKEISKIWDLGIQSWDDFYHLPLTTKEDIWGWEPPRDTKYHTHETSGSTGEPRVIYVPWETWYRKDALFHRSWEWLGRKPHQPVLRLIAGEPKYAWYDWWRGDKVMSRTISPACVDYVIDNRPYLIHGPGGGIRVLCEKIIRRGKQDILKDIKLEWCSESAEGHRERLSPLVAGFYEQYGLAELPTVGSPCLYNMHVVMETGVIEIIGGEIVVTDFNNHVMPIIRYRTGDTGRIRASDCPCGRHHPILYDIKGRRVDYYFGPEVLKPIGWWVVSPISHRYGHIISRWRAEVLPKQGQFILYVVFTERYKNREGRLHRALALRSYRQWIKQETGLNCTIIEKSSAHNWKRHLVKVIDER